jgi:hypothetical protein
LKFVTELIDEIELKKSQFEKILGLSAQLTFSEEILRENIDRYWSPLPTSSNQFENEYAIDSSSASRTICNGIDFFIIRALMIGTKTEPIKKLQFEMIKGIRDPSIANTLERILRDILEIEIIVLNKEKLRKGDLVLIDGNLYGRYTHLLKQLDLPNWEYVPLKLFDQMQKLFEICDEKEIIVAGVSKFSKTRVLSNAILSENGGPMADPDILDVDVIYRWKNNQSGYSKPLLLGRYATREEEINTMSDAPENYINRFFSKISTIRKNWGTEVIRKIPDSPAIAMFHFTPSPYEQPMRIDIPANCLGIRKTLAEVSPYAFINSDYVKPIVRQLTQDWGGRDVYNALLYIVDKEVRLTSDTVDKIYRGVLSRELNISLDYDRSTRRFYR